MKWRRASSCLFASSSSPCCASSCSVIRLNAAVSEAISSSPSTCAKRVVRSPPRTRSAADARAVTGPESRAAKVSPTPIAAISSSRATRTNMVAKVISNVVLWPSRDRYCAAASSVRAIWSRTNGSTKRPTWRNASGPPSSLTMARIRSSDPAANTTGAPSLARSSARSGTGSRSRTKLGFHPARIWPEPSKTYASLSPRSRPWVAINREKAAGSDHIAGAARLTSRAIARRSPRIACRCSRK